MRNASHSPFSFSLVAPRQTCALRHIGPRSSIRTEGLVKQNPLLLTQVEPQDKSLPQKPADSQRGKHGFGSLGRRWRRRNRITRRPKNHRFELRLTCQFSRAANRDIQPSKLVDESTRQSIRAAVDATLGQLLDVLDRTFSASSNDVQEGRVERIDLAFESVRCSLLAQLYSVNRGRQARTCSANASHRCGHDWCFRIGFSAEGASDCRVVVWRGDVLTDGTKVFH